jgi:hypothetical protein
VVSIKKSCIKIIFTSKDLAEISERVRTFYTLESAYEKIIRMADCGELEIRNHQPIHMRQLVKNEKYDISSYLVISPDGRLREGVIKGNLSEIDYENWKEYELKLNLGDGGTEELAKQTKILEKFTEILGREKIEEITPEVVLKATRKGFLRTENLEIERGYIETDE